LLTLSVLHCGGSCERADNNQYHLTIYNNSEEDIVSFGSLYHSMALEKECVKPSTRLEYLDLKRKVIKPYSSQINGIDLVVDFMRTYPDIIWKWSIGIFDWDDVDKMSCEEFERVYPIKKVWDLTLEELEACNWTLVYSPGEE